MKDHTHRSFHKEKGSPQHVNDRNRSQKADGVVDYPSQVNGAKRKPAFSAVPHTIFRQPYQHQALPRRPTQTASLQHDQGPRNAVTDVLPYCTTEPPLTQEQVIALSDVAGSVKELVILALTAAAGDRVSMDRMKAAVGPATANNIMDFFVDEWEVEG